MFPRMTVDDSFKKPGAVPFKWEVKPGVPKAMNDKDHRKLDPPTSPLFLSIPHKAPDDPRHSSQVQTRKLKPPPAPIQEVYSFPQSEPRTRSFRSAPRTRSERWLIENRPFRNGPEIVKPGCFFSPWIKRISIKKRKEIVQKAGTGSESDCYLDLESLPRWSLSSRKTLSPFHISVSSSPASYRSSPRPVNDAEWAGFGLF